jgi:hypothetical protein
MSFKYLIISSYLQTPSLIHHIQAGTATIVTESTVEINLDMMLLIGFLA